MTTIRDELDDCYPYDVSTALSVLGIDPDLSAEWATVDRCLTWLREQGVNGVDTSIRFAPGEQVYVILVGSERRQTIPASTLHNALLAACRAVQEASC